MGEIDRADQKASLLIGSLGIAFSIVLSGILGGDWSLAVAQPVGAVLWIVGALAASGSVVAAAMAVWPRLSKGPGPGRHHLLGPGARARLARGGRRRARRSADCMPPERTYQQLLVLSAVVQRKYRCIRWSMGLAGVGIALVVLAVVLCVDPRGVAP